MVIGRTTLPTAVTLTSTCNSLQRVCNYRWTSSSLSLPDLNRRWTKSVGVMLIDDEKYGVDMSFMANVGWTYRNYYNGAQISDEQRCFYFPLVGPLPPPPTVPTRTRGLKRSAIHLRILRFTNQFCDSSWVPGAPSGPKTCCARLARAEPHDPAQQLNMIRPVRRNWDMVGRVRERDESQNWFMNRRIRRLIAEFWPTPHTPHPHCRRRHRRHRCGCTLM